MSETIVVSQKESKEDKYISLLPQVEALIAGEPDLIANLSNIAAALKETFNFFWVGFYLVKDQQLVLGPFQGPVACTRISLGNGVCGTSWEKGESIIVSNVEKFPGHIACNAASRSEIVIPAIKDKNVVFILDVDSDKLSDFDEMDKKYLEELILIILKN
jgi:L-methionine (R)-S-oxide reductase